MWDNQAFEATDFSTTTKDVGPVARVTTNFDGVNGAGEKNATSKDADKNDDEAVKKKWKSCCQRFVSIMLSHLGTLVLVVVYLIIGGLLFSYLELENEKSACDTTYLKYESKRDEAVDRVYNIAQGENSTLSKTSIKEELEVFAKDVYTLGVDPTRNCSTIGTGDNQPNWVVANSIYFCTTIVTTIGYGHISPATQWGQIVCMIYSLLGIPLMLLFLTKIGEPTAMVFRSFYLNICCCKCFVKPRRLCDRTAEQPEETPGHQTEWKTVEEGDSRQPPPKVGDICVVDDDDDFEDEIVNIPITVTLLLLIIYILIGAAIFTVWEKEWSLVEGTYFSFITLSTIGFGDYVPGKEGPFDDASVILELLVGAVYCLFGLAMLSMCINLIQDEITAKLQWIGNKLGIVKKREESDDDDDEEEEDSSSDDEDDDSSEDERRRARRSARTTTSTKLIATDNGEVSTA